MDKECRRQLVEKIKQQKGAGVIPLEDFFVGNDDYGSIGCNLTEGGPAFFEPLKAIHAKPNVQDVLVQIVDINEGDEMMWPFSDRIYIFSSASRDEIAVWLAPLEPDTVKEAKYMDGVPKMTLEPEMKIYSAWWD